MRPGERLLWWERGLLLGLLAAVVGFGVLVEIRSAFLSRRMGDAGVYFRSAWAVRQGGQDLYSVRCDSGWSYNYPPLLAILLVPMADPPAGQADGGFVSYKTSIAIWYMLNVLALAWGVHTLARALEDTSGEQSLPGSRRWWTLRLWPVLACLTAVGSTLMKGQINLIVLSLLCGFLAAFVRGQTFRAGLYLAGPICIKIFPAFLLLLPLWRRDARCLLGCGLGLFVGLVLIPVVALGPKQTVVCYQDLSRVLLAPALGLGSDESRAKELTGIAGTDNHALVAMFHHAMHRDPLARPTKAAPITSAAHWLLGGTMTVLALIVFRRRLAQHQAAHDVLFGGVLMMLMLLVCPVAHLHYYCLSVPLIMSLLVLDRAGGVYPGAGLGVLMAFHFVSVLVEQLPGLEVLRDLRLAGYGGLTLWAAGCWAGRARTPLVSAPMPLARAA
jgi:hypothetical protein